MRIAGGVTGRLANHLVLATQRLNKFPLPLASTAQQMFIHVSIFVCGDEDNTAITKKTCPGVALPKVAS